MRDLSRCHGSIVPPGKLLCLKRLRHRGRRPLQPRYLHLFLRHHLRLRLRCRCRRRLRRHHSLRHRRLCRLLQPRYLNLFLRLCCGHRLRGRRLRRCNRRRRTRLRLRQPLRELRHLRHRRCGLVPPRSLLRRQRLRRSLCRFLYLRGCCHLHRPSRLRRSHCLHRRRLRLPLQFHHLHLLLSRRSHRPLRPRLRCHERLPKQRPVLNRRLLCRRQRLHRHCPLRHCRLYRRRRPLRRCLNGRRLPRRRLLQCRCLLRRRRRSRLLYRSRRFPRRHRPSFHCLRRLRRSLLQGLQPRYLDLHLPLPGGGSSGICRRHCCRRCRRSRSPLSKQSKLRLARIARRCRLLHRGQGRRRPRLCRR